MLHFTHMQRQNMKEYFLMVQQIYKNRIRVNKKGMIGMFQILNVIIKRHMNIIEIFKYFLKK